MINRDKAIKQLNELNKLGKSYRLAADGWNRGWHTLIATLMSAQTTDKITIPTAQKLFDKYRSLSSLSKAQVSDIKSIIKVVNYNNTKAKNIKKLANILLKKHNSKVPEDFDKLIQLPGVGRKTANVFLAVQGHNAIGVDTHLSYTAQYLGWSDNKTPDKIEFDLQKQFPKRLWGRLNWIVVRFGQTYTNRKEKNKVLDSIIKIK